MTDQPSATPAEPATAATAAPPAPPAMSGPAYLRLIGLGAAVGIPAAVVSVAFLGLVHEVEHLLWHTWPEHLGLSTPPVWMVLGLPVVGAALAWAARALLPGDGGHEPLHGISLAPTPVAAAAGVALAAVASLAFGAVLGPEGPLIALGSIVGMVAVRWWKVTGPGAQVVSTAGAFSAISALFGGPVVAGALLLEAGVGLGTSLIPALLPGAVAAAVGYVIITGLGSWSGIPTAPMTVPALPAYPTTRVVDLALAIAAGLVMALVVHVVRGVATRVEAARQPAGRGPVLLLSGLAIGVLALLIQHAGGAYDDVLFSGQSSIPALLGESSEGLVLAIALAKALAYALCLGAGFRGGPVFPAIFIGVAVTLLIGGPLGMSTTAALAIGTACGMAAFTRLIFSSLVFALLLGGTAGLSAIPAATLAAATAWVVGRVLDGRTPTSSTTTTASGPGSTGLTRSTGRRGR
jgi:H+/Cl- antiporter ClcA